MNARGREGAWTNYWASAGQGSERGGCLPKALGEVEALLAGIWRETARELPRGARVLDLATGDGAVLRTMRAVRADLKLVGIDSAAKLPAAPKGISLRPGIAMESLPFADASINIATSQFGFEYGDVRAIAAELARVIVPSGGFRFIVHHAGGPIISHNMGRRRALAWAAEESGLLTKARALVAARARIALPTPPFFAEAPAEARRLFPAQTVATEFATAIHQTLELGRRSPPRETLDVLATLEIKAREEIARIDALCDAARDSGGIARITATLREAGLGLADPEPLYAGSADTPLAWRLSGNRR